MQEWIVIAFVALVVLGPDRLPQVARKAGELLTRFRSETRRNVEEFKRIAEIQDLERELDGLRHELRSTRDDVTRSAGGSPRGRPGTRVGRRGMAGAGPAERGAPVRPDDAPPPVDLEAT